MRKRTIFGLLALLLSSVFTVALLCYTLSVTTSGERVPTVVLDAGHGGIDGGVCGVESKIKESDINLAIVQFLQTDLEERGIRVVLTRKTSAGLYGAATRGFKRRDMAKRKEIIQKAMPQAVVSVHQNFFSKQSKRGATVFYKPNAADGKRLASCLQAALGGSGATPTTREPLLGDYYILNCSDYPSVIAECGFLSNREDEALLIGESYQRELSARITQGILVFLAKNT